METKVCKNCLEDRPIERFRKRPSGIYSPVCRRCYSKNWYSNNPYYQKEYDKKRWKDKKEIEKVRVSKWNKENRKDRVAERMKTEPLFCLTVKIRWCIKSTFKKSGYSKNSKTYEILGITYGEFKSYIENQFVEGMSWTNHGEWHLDHKTPISWAKTDDIYKLNHYTNFQPLWAYDNLSKSNKFSG